MNPLPPQDSRNELGTYHRASSLGNDHATLMGRAGAKISQYSHVSASDQARQHIGDVFHAPVTYQNFATTSLAATAPALEFGRDRLMESLVFKEMDARFVDVHPNLVGTCEWLSETPEYKRWMNPELMSTHHGFFWIKGKAGVGKSTLMKHASVYAEARCSARQHVLNFFFHARGGSFETCTDGLFRSLLHQLLEKVPAAYDLLDKRRLGLVQRQGWSSALLKDTFRESVLSLDQDQVTCYIDAMDECHENYIDDIIRYFDNLGDAFVAEAKRFYVCLSSRHYPNLRSSKSVELLLENQYGHDKDIRRYIQQRLMIDDKALEEDLAESIRSRAYGVFLWVVLVVALVNQDDRNGNVAEIYQRLDRIPTGLSELFNELIRRGSKSDHLRPLLQWVAFSNRPLLLKELYCILMHVPSKSGLELPAYDRNNVAKFILSASKGLVEIPARAFPRVQFIHESLRTYLSGEGVAHLIDHMVVDRFGSHSIRPGVQESVATSAYCHYQLNERCLSYIMQIIPELSPPPLDLERRRQRLVETYPFFVYAVRGATEHANTALDLGLTQQSFVDALPWKELDIMLGISKSFRYGGHEIVNLEPWHEIVNVEPWHKACVAAKSGCPKLLKALLEIHTPFQANSKQWGAILSASIEACDGESVSIALRAGADPNAPSPTNPAQCLQYAVYHASRPRFGNLTHITRRWHIVELLLKHGAKPYATIESPDDCLYEASSKNDLKAARTLLGEHLIADTQCSDYGVSLARAAGQASRLGNGEMFQFFLDKGSETGWWSRATLKTPADVDAFHEVKFEDTSILRTILLEGARVLPSTELRARIVLSGVLKGSTSVVMHFERGSWFFSQF